ncbi:cyclic pyranopterin monophosphate synthase subunit MoaC [Pseudarcicella hirudinis]|uniref:cyclic pyranopterin monophosphate synthase n=2 Tax=Pseudarcicella hirudinis TaxID=1079859 RepID=A0A1I5NXS8_9BACT|nr:cyclic pyranopterin monophosphate synthase subunit MoaC [Pseudarcicella hirudinis]
MAWGRIIKPSEKSMSQKIFSHLDSENNPSMVDVSEKAITKRTATARSIVVLNEEIMANFKEGDIQTKKGAVFQTAIIAGTMGAKKTSDLIPLCHPLGLDSCKFAIEVSGNEVIIDCTCSLTAKTGVEMEALTGASIAALTVYDMCKAFSHDIIIRETKLTKKTGGKSDFIRE